MGLFQFSLWDSQQNPGPVQNPLPNFQFSLWDSFLMLILLLFLIRTFNSLYEIHFIFIARAIMLLHFQFSLWDSILTDMYYLEIITFNSLYEIHTTFCTILNQKRITFNSLYEIQKKEIVLNLQFQFCFQFSLWDSLKSMPHSGQLIVFQFSLWDSIFSHGQHQFCLASFNSLYEIRLQNLPFLLLLNQNFQFSLWDSSNEFWTYPPHKNILSILFMRFKIMKFYSFEECHFQFSLWDSHEVWFKSFLMLELSILFMRFDIIIFIAPNGNIFQFSLWDSFQS